MQLIILRTGTSVKLFHALQTHCLFSCPETRKRMLAHERRALLRLDSSVRQTSFVRQLGKRVDIAVSPELKAKELEKKMTCSNDRSGERPLIDAPIRSLAEDDLRRAPVAYAFAQSILELDASQGLVLGVLGPWGHGKSSLINLMREKFEKIPKEFESSEELEPTSEESETRRALTVIDFNPWMFSVSHQLVDFFFTQIGAELKIKNKRRFRKIAKLLQKYGGILRPAFQLIPFPGAGAVGDLIVGAAGKTSADHSAQKVKDDITETLSKLEKPIVVVIDDIDRLTKIEIREIFKLVRLTASFPNIIYLLAFDRERVEQALSEDGVSGRAYLEKIVLMSFDVPQASEKLLRSRALAELKRILSPVTNATLDEDRWPSAYLEVIEPLFSNMRNVVRYAISSKEAIRELGDQIDLVDLLVMEAIRILRPEIFERLLKLQHDLVNPPIAILQEGGETEDPINALLKEFPEDRFILQYLFNSTFPATQHKNSEKYAQHNSIWRRKYRMAHVDFFNLYLERVASDPLTTFPDSERAFTYLNDGAALKKYLLTELDPEKLEDVISDLTSFESKFTDDMIVPESVTLLNLIDTIPKENQHNLFGREFPVYCVVRKLLHPVEHTEDEKEREAFISQIFNDIETYSSRFFFIDDIIDYIQTNENKFVSEKFMKQIHAIFTQKLLDFPPSEPSREWCAGRVYLVVQKETGEASLSASDDPALLQAVLHLLRSTAVSWSSESPESRSEDHLHWEAIKQLFGSENEIRIIVDKVRNELGDDEVLRLADQYLSGRQSAVF